jgi:hypothetical protein
MKMSTWASRLLKNALTAGEGKGQDARQCQNVILREVDCKARRGKPRFSLDCRTTAGDRGSACRYYRKAAAMRSADAAESLKTGDGEK